VKYADLLIARPRDGQPVPEPRGAGVSLNFNLFERFDGNIDVFAQHAREKGANVAGPVEQPWNVREVTVLDLDGYRLAFIVPINISLGFDKVIEHTSTLTHSSSSPTPGHTPPATVAPPRRTRAARPAAARRL
jgi:hypothetical protein